MFGFDNLKMKQKSHKIVLLFLLVCCISSCNKKKKKALDRGPVLPIIELATQTTALHQYYVGDLQAIQNVEIRARVQGFLEKVFVDEGKEVKKGQLLFLLSDKEYKAGVSTAQANLKRAIAQTLSSQLELERKRPLVEKGIISPSELKVAEADYQAVKASIERAESELANAQTKLSYTHLKAPFNGITDRNPFKVGSLINEGTLLTTISDIQSINAYFNISERDYIDYIKNKRVNPGEKLDEVELILADGSVYPFKGKLEKKDGSFDDNTGTIDFRASFPNPHKLLRHGSAGQIRLTRFVKDALLVPQKATFEIQDKMYVFVVDSLDTVHIKSFSAKRRYADYYIVSAGLKSGDKIVFEGIQKAKDGMKIVPRPLNFDSLMAPKNPTNLTQAQ